MSAYGRRESAEEIYARLCAADGEPCAEPWSEPFPLCAASTLPAFPTGALPAWLRDYVEALAEETQTPVDMAGLLSLAFLAAACQGRYWLTVRPGWEEPLTLWVMVVLGPGNRKSGVFKALCAPIRAYQRDEAERLKVEVRQSAERLDVLEGKLKAAKTAVIKGSGDMQEVDALAAEVARFRPVRAPRLLADDVTPEALVELIEKNDGRLAILSPEGGSLFGVFAGRYTSHGGANLDAFLKAHTGDDISVDRLTRGGNSASAPVLTVGLTVQPFLLEGAMSNLEFQGRGLLARFLYALPDDPMGRRNCRAPSVPPAIADAYRAGVARLLALEPERDKAGEVVPCLLSPSANALEALLCFSEVQEPELGRGGSLSPVKDFCSKLAGAAARIAGLLHLAEWGPDGGSRAVDASSMAAALEIAHWARAHALAAFSAMGADPAVSSAEVILHWIKRERLQDFSQRDAFNALRSRFRRADELDAPLLLLVDHGFIRLRAEEPRTGPGRKRSPVFDVNPSTHNTHNTQNTQNGGSGANSAYSAYSAGPSEDENRDGPESLRPEDEVARQEVKIRL